MLKAAAGAMFRVAGVCYFGTIAREKCLRNNFQTKCERKRKGREEKGEREKETRRTLFPLPLSHCPLPPSPPEKVGWRERGGRKGAGEVEGERWDN